MHVYDVSWGTRRRLGAEWVGSGIGSRLRAAFRRGITPWQRSWRGHHFAQAEEGAFRAFHADRTYAQARCGIALGFVAWCGFAIWDVMAFPALCLELITVRLLLVAPVLGGLWWFLANRPQHFKARMSLYLACGPWAASVGLLLMLELAYRVTPEQAFVQIWPAFAGIFFFEYAFLGLLFAPAALLGNVSLVLVGLFGVSSHVPTATLVGAFLTLASFNVLGMIVCAREEIHQRMLFRVGHHYRRQVGTARQERENARRARDEACAERVRSEMALTQLELERTKVEGLTHERERFFSAAFHDLQQPLSIIGLYVRLAKGKVEGGQVLGVEPELAAIEGAAQDIAAMFKGVREAWDLGHAAPELALVDVNELLAEIALELRTRAERKGLSLRFRPSRAAPCCARSDRALLKRAVCNLVINAIKYSQQGGVVLGAVRTRDRITISVRDTGVGIAEAWHGRVFDEFVRVNDPAQARQPGLGLGLSIVRRIQQALPEHRLELWSRSGRGSRFSLIMPAAAKDSTASCPMLVPAPVRDALRDKYVLVVEDERLILDGLLESLRAAGCVAEGVAGVVAARSLLASRDRCPDALVTDHRLRDGETGADIVAVLREQFEWAAATPVVFVTGALDWPGPPQGFDGRWQVLRKPIDPDGLVRRLGALLSRNPA